MAVTRERFEQGLTYDGYKAQMTRNQDRFEANEKNLEIKPDDLAAFKKLPRPLNVLVIAEDWCGDVIANVPIIGRLAKDSGKLNLRVFLEQAGTTISPSIFLMVSGGMGVAGTLICAFTGLHLGFAPLAGLTLAALPFGWLYFKRKRRLSTFGKQLPEALELVGRALRDARRSSNV